MIDYNKTYEDNISRDENIVYSKFVDQVIKEGKIDDKYNTLLNEDFIINLVSLALHKLISSSKNSKNTSDIKKEVANIGKLCFPLNNKIITSIIKPMGIKNIVSYYITDVCPFDHISINSLFGLVGFDDIGSVKIEGWATNNEYKIEKAMRDNPYKDFSHFNKSYFRDMKGLVIADKVCNVAFDMLRYTTFKDIAHLKMV